MAVRADDNGAQVLEPPDYPERVIIGGSNGSGKTRFAEQLLGAGYSSTVTVDFKGEFQHPNPKAEIVRNPKDPKLEQEGHWVYRPAAEHRSRDWLEYFFARMERRAYARRPFILYVDEGHVIARRRAITHLAEIAIMGRSFNCGLWVSSQRPSAWIPVEIRSEAWRWYVFYLSDEEDELAAVRFAKTELTLEQLREATHSYRFLELRRGAESGGRVRVRAYGKLPLPRTTHPSTRRS